jgi:hypothetical protein
MIGFSNALAIIIFLGQIPSFEGKGQCGEGEDPEKKCWYDGTTLGLMIMEVAVTIIVAIIAGKRSHDLAKMATRLKLTESFIKQARKSRKSRHPCLGLQPLLS